MTAAPASDAPRSERGWWIAAGALVLVKFWLVSAQTIQAIGPSMHDDLLFLKLAARLLGGNWLGPYTELTLCKGPMYPLWIAGVFLTGIPLFAAQHLLYTGACAVFVRVLRPWLGPAWVAFACFVVLLYHPISYETSVHSRVFRQDILPAQALFALAGLLALARPPGAVTLPPRRPGVGWALLAGLAMGAFWLTREETIWFVPLWLGLWLWLAASHFAELRRGERTILLRLALPLLAWAGSVGLVASVNWRVYGVFTTCEFRSGAFPQAYGALTRVKPPERMLRVPVTRAAREMIYPVSPAFAELKPFLEGQEGLGWAGGASAEWTGLPAEAREIGGGWFMWALRDAVRWAGHGRSAPEAAAFYQRVADEVNAACDQGRLPAHSRRSGFLAPLAREDLPVVRGWFFAAAAFFFRLQEMHVRPLPSVGSPEQLELFTSLTRGRLTPPKDASPLPRIQRDFDHVRLSALGLMAGLYQALAVPVGLLAFAAWVVVSLVQLRRLKVSVWLVYHLGVLASITALCLIHALITATSFGSIHPGSFSAVYPLWVAFPFTVWAQTRDGGWRTATPV